MILHSPLTRRRKRWWLPDRWAYVPGLGEPAALLEALKRYRVPIPPTQLGADRT